jgi:hypothetical protein
MRRSLCGAVGLVAVGLLTLTAAPSRAEAAEHGLLGIRLFNKYSDVLKKYGQPNRIEIGAATGGVSGGAAAGPGGGMMGGGSGMMGGPAMMGGGSSSSSMMAMMGGGGGKMAMMGGGGLPGMGGMGMGSGSSSMMQRMMGGGGAPDLGGGPGEGMSLSGGPGSAGAQSSSSDGEITWVYNHGAVTDFFLFNKDGRVIQIQSFGYKGSAITAAGVHLGDQVSKLYQKYGWTSNLTQSGTNMTVDYTKEHQAAFQLADTKDGHGYRVVGITVGVADNNVIHSIGAPAGGGMMGGSMGMGSGSGSMMQQMMGGGARRGGGKTMPGAAGLAR